MSQQQYLLTFDQRGSCVHVSGTTIVISLKYTLFLVAAASSVDASVKYVYKYIKKFTFTLRDFKYF